ncbi:hypothetical protein F5884DRAFT_796609 [Xylogone sp. PMI_703]|nr:hypothetical protein F5884DRAFT_796609 [Xylogone sp. PMI_703]
MDHPLLETNSGYSLQQQNTHKSDTASSRLKSDDSAQFHLFPKLPIEIRALIWQMSIDEERLVEVYPTTTKGWRAPIPPILHVCMESRALGLKNYELAFSGKDPDTGKLCPARIYFNFDHDTLYFKEGWSFNVKGCWRCIRISQTYISQDDIQRVKSLCLDIETETCVPKEWQQTSHNTGFDGWLGLKTFIF